MFCCTLLYVHSSISIILMGKRVIALLNLSSWCLVMVERLFLAVPRGCLQFVIVVFPDHTHLLFLIWVKYKWVLSYKFAHPKIFQDCRDKGVMAFSVTKLFLQKVNVSSVILLNTWKYNVCSINLRRNCCFCIEFGSLCLI